MNGHLEISLLGHSSTCHQTQHSSTYHQTQYIEIIFSTDMVDSLPRNMLLQQEVVI